MGQEDLPVPTLTQSTTQNHRATHSGSRNMRDHVLTTKHSQRLALLPIGKDQYMADDCVAAHSHNQFCNGAKAWELPVAVLLGLRTKFTFLTPAVRGLHARPVESRGEPAPSCTLPTLARLGLASVRFSLRLSSASLAMDDSLGRALPITNSRGRGAGACAVELELGIGRSVAGCLGEAGSTPSSPVARGRLPARPRLEVRIGGGAPAWGPRTFGVSGAGPIEGGREPDLAVAAAPG
mmetsp:Transcript_12814/g.31935  ORF Transcript_12814/g.31935 Transcript_12814/m.31935 type:complete len:237 (-) Transcript_12814:2840-3550(-)